GLSGRWRRRDPGAWHARRGPCDSVEPRRPIGSGFLGGRCPRAGRARGPDERKARALSNPRPRRADRGDRHTADRHQPGRDCARIYVPAYDLEPVPGGWSQVTLAPSRHVSCNPWNRDPMKFEYTPVLSTQRELYRFPRGAETFREYLRTLVDPGSTDVRLPLPETTAERTHLPRFLDALATVGADAIGARATAAAAAPL